MQCKVLKEPNSERYQTKDIPFKTYLFAVCLLLCHQKREKSVIMSQAEQKGRK
jgi:hypothetical protein